MKFKIDANLVKVASAAGAGATDYRLFARLLCEKLVQFGVIEDTPDNYGVETINVIGEASLYDVVGILHHYLGDIEMTVDTFLSFCCLIIMGDGDCPHCGGKLRFIETEGHELNDGDYYTPNSYVIDKYVYKCTVCEETIKSEKEL